MSGCCLFCGDSDEDLEKIPSDIAIIALINPRGGSGKGSKIMSRLKSFENCHVLDIMTFVGDMAQKSKDNLIRLANECAECRVIFCGGDGTVIWGFEILDWAGLSFPVAILPLGTANEISKCTGWNNAYVGGKLDRFVQRVRARRTFDFDIWNVVYEDDLDQPNLETPERRPKLMGAFLSFGTDANIACKFHKKRENKKGSPTILASKLSYVRYDISEIFNPFKELSSVIKIEVDGKVVNTEGTYRCLQVLNINSMSNGVNFFGDGKSNSGDLLKEGQYSTPKLNDGKLEIVTESSVHQYNMCYLGVIRGRRISQGEKIVITLDCPVPMEVDGEPFVNPKGKVIITSAGRRKMVLGNYENSNTKKGISFD